jgi:hypothetical protein
MEPFFLMAAQHIFPLPAWKIALDTLSGAKRMKNLHNQQIKRRFCKQISRV